MAGEIQNRRKAQHNFAHHRFNEAPAQWPGKYRYTEPFNAYWFTSFNEAPAQWPGKLEVRCV
jgi:hypothetical protein